MDVWELIARRKIAEAMEQGEFDNLRGQGLPLPQEDETYTDPATRMAHRLLKNNGLAPAWIEERRDLDRAIQILRQTLARAPKDMDAAALRARYGRTVAELNRRILSYNLTAPQAASPLLEIDLEHELAARKSA